MLIGASCCMGESRAAELQGESSEDRDYVLGRPMTEEEIGEIEAAVAPYAGMGGYQEEDTVYTYAAENVPMPSGMDIPHRYDIRDEGADIVIESQRYGDCWAFAALDLLQINAWKQGITNIPDLSERHLVYYTYHSVCGTPGQQSGEGTAFWDNGQITQCFWNGGKYDYAIRSLSSYLGAVPEYIAPYGEAAVPLTGDGDAYLSACIRLKSANVFPAADRELLKRMVLQYGAVGITYCSNLNYYEYSTAAQYCPSDIRADHAVTVIGWDDDYRKENFKTRPESDGAWLVQNSWGTIFGDEGFFWLSYEDASIAENAYVMEATAVSREYVYQCDNTIMDNREMAEKELQVANCYTLEGTWGCDEILKAVNITVPVGGMGYRLELFDLTAGKDFGEQTLLPEPVTGQIGRPGNITIELPYPVVMAYGSKVGIALTFYGDTVGICTDAAGISGRTVCTSEGGTGVSYRMTTGQWEDYGARTGRNFRVKLLTDPAVGEILTISEIFANYLRIEDGRQSVEYLYRHLLQRQGEEQGVSYWQAYRQTNDPIMVVAGFLWSPEYRLKHPETVAGTELARCVEMQTGRAVGEICQLYQSILHRECDLPGLLYYLERQSEGMTISEMEKCFYLSPEYMSLQG